jgi:DNA-binding FadR family transcriptional regulator
MVGTMPTGPNTARQQQVQQVIDLIVRQIEDGTLPFGSWLATTKEMCDRFGISQWSAHEVRNALKRGGYIAPHYDHETHTNGMIVIWEPAAEADPDTCTTCPACGCPGMD